MDVWTALALIGNVHFPPCRNRFHPSRQSGHRHQGATIFTRQFTGHRFAYTMASAKRFSCRRQAPLQLARRNAFLAGAHQMDGLQPQAQRQVAILKYAANAHRERFAAGVALVKARAGRLAAQLADLVATRIAMRADGAVRPQFAFNVFKRGCFVVKARVVKNRISHWFAPLKQ